MGTGNASGSGGLDRPEVAQVKQQQQSDAQRLNDPAMQARGYRIDTDTDSKTMRIVFFGQHGQTDIRTYMVLDTPESYEMAALILKNYDRLEGIDK